MTDNCIFCLIATGQSPAAVLWRDRDYLAFLDIYPDHPGQTVVIPRQHHGSQFSRVDQAIVTGLVECCHYLARLLEAQISSSRVIFQIQGFEVDHLHGVLTPIPLPLPVPASNRPRPVLADRLQLEQLAVAIRKQVQNRPRPDKGR